MMFPGASQVLNMSRSKAPPTSPFPHFMTVIGEKIPSGRIQVFPVLPSIAATSSPAASPGETEQPPGALPQLPLTPRSARHPSQCPVPCWGTQAQPCRCCPGTFALLRAKASAEGSKGSMGSGRGQRQGKLWNSPNGDIHSHTETPGMSETRPWGRDNSTITAKLESRPWLACSCWGKKNDEKTTKYLAQAPGPAGWTQPWRAGPWQEPGHRVVSTMGWGWQHSGCFCEVLMAPKLCRTLPAWGGSHRLGRKGLGPSRPSMSQNSLGQDEMLLQPRSPGKMHSCCFPALGTGGDLRQFPLLGCVP